MSENIAKCANCDAEIDLNVDAQTSCSQCRKHFCFCLRSMCFTDYHRKNNLIKGHSAFSIMDPTWKINLRPSS